MKIIKSLSKWTLIAFLFTPLFLSSTIHVSNGDTNNWLKNELSYAEKLNIKDPSLALAYLEKFKYEHLPSLDTDSLALVNSQIAKNLYEVGYFDDALTVIDENLISYPTMQTKPKIVFLSLKGNIFSFSGKAKEGYELLKKAIDLAISIQDTALLSDAYSYLASAYADNESDLKALQYYNKAFHILSEKEDNLELAYLQLSMAQTYQFIGDLEKSIILAENSLAYFLEHNLYYDVIISYQILSYMYLDEHRDELAIEVLEKAVEISERIADKRLNSATFFSLSYVYAQQGNVNKGKYYWYLADQIKQDETSEIIRLNHLIVKADLDLQEGDIDSAMTNITVIDKLLENRNDAIYNVLYIYLNELKIMLAKYNDDYEQALTFQKEIQRLETFSQNEKREEDTTKYQIMFDTEKTLLKNQILEHQKILDETTRELLNKKDREFIALSVMSAIVICILFLCIYRFSRRKLSLTKLMNIDGLTLLTNRRYAFEQASIYFDSFEHKNTSITLIIFDIDHFKTLNETYGHTAGDIALQHVSGIAQKFIRDSDILARIGGNEFLMVLPNTRIDVALDIAERLRLTISNDPIIKGEECVNISASFGVSERSVSTLSFNELHKQSDKALHEAKLIGRNCVVSSQLDFS